MRDADETVQRLQTSLRDAKPADGMEQRILTAIQDATAAREAASAGRRWVWSPGWSRPVLAMLMGGAAVLTVGLVLVVTGHPHRQTPAHVGSLLTRADARRTVNPLEAAQKASGQPRPAASGVPLSRVTTRVSTGARSHHVFADQASTPSSYPAPPLPLTQQERLLLRVARRRDPGNMTILNPDVRGAQTARAMAQFQKFFGMNDHEMRTQLE